MIQKPSRYETCETGSPMPLKLKKILDPYVDPEHHILIVPHVIPSLK